MADQKRTDADRSGSSATAAAGRSGSAAPSGGVDPATSPIASGTGIHTGREPAGTTSSGMSSSSGMGSTSGGYGSASGMNTSDMGSMSGGLGSGGMADRARQQAGNLTDQARKQAGNLAGKARHAVEDQLSSQKDRAAEGLGGISDALRQTSQTFRSSDQDMIAGYIEDAAMYVDRVTGFLQNRSIGDLLHEAERVARREPAIFIGGAFVIGILGARFLKASRPDSSGYAGGGYAPSFSGSAGYGSESSYSSGSYGGSRTSRSGLEGRSSAGRSGSGTQDDHFGSYVPGGVAGDYTRTHAYEESRTGSAADEALGSEARTASTNDREGF